MCYSAQQGLLGTKVYNAIVAINELIADHATNKTTIDECRTAIIELIDDHATNKTTIDESRTAIIELIDDHATFVTVVGDIKTLVNDIRSKLMSDTLLSDPGLGIGSTPTAVATAEVFYTINGVLYRKDAVAAGTAPGNDVIPQSTYGAVALDIGADGTIDAIEAADNATGYGSAALAIEGLAAVAADHVRLGTVTATKSDGAFTFGTTNLNAANSTVAYTDATGSFQIGSAVSSSPPATLAATDPTASAGTLTAGDPTASAATLAATTITNLS